MLDIPAAQEGFENAGRRRVLGDQPVAGGAVDHEGFVQARDDTAIKSSIHILAQRRAGFTQFFQQLEHGWCFQAPAIGGLGSKNIIGHFKDLSVVGIVVAH